MFEIIWGIFNTALLIYFIVVCLKAIGIIRKNLGIIATVVFVTGLISLIGSSVIEKSNSKTFNSNYQTNLLVKDLENSLLTKISMSIIFEKNTNENKILNIDIDKYGFLIGTEWKSTSVNISKVQNDVFKYNI